MKITRDVILDLLPLYLAEEVSADTRVLVEEYLRSDPQLAKVASEGSAIDLPNNIAVPVNEEAKMESYKQAKRLWLLGSIVLAVVVSVAVGLAVMALFLVSRPMVGL
jgi:hypothetical protein